MRTVGSKGLLLFAATFLLTCSSRAVTESPDVHPAKSWLDNAVSAKQCPATPVNVPASDKEGVNSLLKRITISGDKLYINGTDDPDHIVVSSGGSSQLVRVAWDGKQLGRFGPIKKIELRGHGGDDVLIVKSSVTLPVLIDGGSGDDCIQGGSGADQLFGSDGNDVLIAGTGRPALDGGSGNDRVVIAQPMGTLRYAPAADSGILRSLEQLYHLEPLSKSGSPNKGTPSPVILGSADLGDQQVLSELQTVRTAGQSIVLTNATPAQSEQLRLQLGQPNSANPGGTQSGSTSETTDPLTYFRSSPQPGTRAYDYATGKCKLATGHLNDPMTASISQIFSANAIAPKAPADGPANDIKNLASAYITTYCEQNSAGDSLTFNNQVYDVRSFQNQADFYWVNQVYQYHVESNPIFFFGIAQNFIASFPTVPGLVETSPASTECTDSTTSSVGYSIGGSAGWNYSQIANATLTGGVSISNSSTISCPQIKIVNQSNPGSGQANWEYLLSDPEAGDYQFVNQWIWQVPFSAYQKGQDNLVFTTNVGGIADGSINIIYGSGVPLPFGQTFALQEPVVTSVNPTCVYPGHKFAINGTGFYPSLVGSVELEGNPLPLANYSFAVPKGKSGPVYISVVAPQQSGDDQSVVVKSALGESNANVTVTIPYYVCTGSDAGGKKK